jgi:phosphoglucosamine mutase
MTKLFGTDGIRGKANEFPMMGENINRVGQALGHLLKKNGMRSNRERPKVVIGKDTRLSGYMVEMALASGLNSMGVDVQLVGPLPTPGVGFLTRNMRADAGIVISASHNPYYDNGIKIFGHDGFKISRQWEQEIERLVASNELESELAQDQHIGRSKRIDDSQGRYVVYVKNTFPMQASLEGFRIVLDCANGAGYKVGPQILEELGAEVILIGNTPNGLNINDKCGALFPQRTAEAVLTYRADAGISLDGDADRVIMVDETGEIVSGDHILAICGLHMKAKGQLRNNTVVTTQMANFGLDRLMAEHGIKLIKTDVGDKYVVEEMRKGDYCIGGESSGHVIFIDNSTTGDGMIAALAVLGVMLEEKKPLSRLKDKLQIMPQVLLNVRVRKKMALEDIKGYKELIASIDTKLNKKGRVFVRFSGTEPLIRILVEGPDSQAITSYAEEIAAFLQKSIES